jgi:hypothetical protein
MRRPLSAVAGGMAKWYEARAADEAVIQILRAFLTVPIVSSRARQYFQPFDDARGPPKSQTVRGMSA